MIRKSILFLVVAAIFASVDAFAVPSVKKLGTSNVSANTVKQISVLPKTQVSTPSSDSLQVKSATTPVSRVSTSDANTRLSAGVSSIKAISSGGLSTVPSGGSGQYGTAGTITDVVTSGTGHYVTEVAMRGDNKLGVTKTNLLYAPVRRASSDAVVDTVEIWVVK